MYPNEPIQNISDPESLKKTGRGFLLIGIGLLLSWFPYIEYLGFFLVVIGLFFIVTTDRNFVVGRYRTFIWLSILIWVLSFLITLGISGLTMGSISQIVSENVTNSQKIIMLQSTFRFFLISSEFFVIFISLSYLLLPWKLSVKIEKFLLILSFALSVAIGIVIISILIPRFDSILVQLVNFDGNNLSGLNSVMSLRSSLQLLEALPLLLFAVTYFHVSRRMYEMGD